MYFTSLDMNFGEKGFFLVISLYVLSLIFGPCCLSEFTLAGPQKTSGHLGQTQLKLNPGRIVENLKQSVLKNNLEAMWSFMIINHFLENIYFRWADKHKSRPERDRRTTFKFSFKNFLFLSLQLWKRTGAWFFKAIPKYTYPEPGTRRASNRKVSLEAFIVRKGFKIAISSRKIKAYCI